MNQPPASVFTAGRLPRSDSAVCSLQARGPAARTRRRPPGSLLCDRWAVRRVSRQTSWQNSLGQVGDTQHEHKGSRA